MLPSTTLRKRAMTRSELTSIVKLYSAATSFDDALFLALLLSGFHSLLCLGELTWPDDSNLQDYHKVIMRISVHVQPSSYQFTLPGHKADHLFEGSRVLIQSTILDDNPFAPFTKYLARRDHLFPF